LINLSIELIKALLLYILHSDDDFKINE